MLALMWLPAPLTVGLEAVRQLIVALGGSTGPNA
jgi:hypothetical protein